MTFVLDECQKTIMKNAIESNRNQGVVHKNKKNSLMTDNKDAGTQSIN